MKFILTLRILLPSVLTSQQATKEDPFNGAWRLNVGKSKMQSCTYLWKAGSILFLTTALFVGSSSAQVITGAVIDPSGAAVAGAQVEVASPALIEQQPTVTTNDVGRFTFINLERTCIP